MFYSQTRKYKVRLPPEYESKDSELSERDNKHDYMPSQMKQPCLYSDRSGENTSGLQAEYFKK